MNDRMPCKDTEERKDKDRLYYLKNREKRLEYAKEYREKNKDKIKEYENKNKEKIKQRKKEYNQTPARKKSQRISDWKKRGVMCDDWDELYEKYITTELCEECNCVLTEDKQNTKTTRCLDHDHQTGLFRNVICNGCNVRRG